MIDYGWMGGRSVHGAVPVLTIIEKFNFIKSWLNC